ncbi:MAG: bifunctional DNA-formamidopyrimidine glycosylase/DNA-(apurinic or apyrimidinic site) lyase [Planctomycetes bacterium]|nr:bifunctional DNA-formamidopyrimidine glycosylase/DNA-(apurinic or apyrimidinic site) lyase [Planctomycetota bacterium]
MPELPEVETVARLIRPKLVGRSIEACTVRWKRTTGGLDARALAKLVVGARVTRVWRRAKYIVFDLERSGAPAGALLGHLRMTGRMQVDARGVDPGPFVKVSFDLDDDHVFHFLDVRKFGRLVFTEDAAGELAELGPEPLSAAFTADGFFAALRAKRRAMKPLLLDQAFVAGLGNIYVDEALFRAGIHPLTKSERLARDRSDRLHAAIRAVLAEAIEREGSSFDVFYRTPEGNPGSFQDQFQVYGRGGEPCRACGTKITRLVVGQRGTHVCRRCQKR